MEEGGAPKAGIAGYLDKAKVAAKDFLDKPAGTTGWVRWLLLEIGQVVLGEDCVRSSLQIAASYTALVRCAPAHVCVMSDLLFVLRISMCYWHSHILTQPLT